MRFIVETEKRILNHPLALLKVAEIGPHAVYEPCGRGALDQRGPARQKTACLPSPPNRPARIPNRCPPPEDTSVPAVYITRLPEPDRRFVWEIRRLTTIVLGRSREDFTRADRARHDGMAALEALTGL